MGIDGWLERIEAGAIATAVSVNEAAWRDTWTTHDVYHLDPVSMAFVGGALADRLAWVFHAGYQAMMRRTFPFCPADGWTSYLVAEDRSGEYPAAVLKKAGEGRRLSGCKSWVAASDHVDFLVVRAAFEDHHEYALVGRGTRGVHLSSRESPSFLPDLSQGFATFENVLVGEKQVFSRGDLSGHFSGEEPYHVLLALCAHIAAQTLKHGGPLTAEIVAPIRMAREMAEKDLSAHQFMKSLVRFDRATTRAASQFGQYIESENKELFLRWHWDKRLVEMFTRGLEKGANGV